jgi:hypothetical protein
MATTQTIQIKRSSTTAAPSTSLAAGELAYSSNSDKLFIGHPDGTTGNIVIASTAPLTVGGDSGTDVTINIQDLLDIVGDTGITTTIAKAGTTATLNIDLDDTAVTPGSYGSTTAIPTFTVDQQGRLTAAGSVAISTTLTIQSDDAVDNGVDLTSDKLKLLGGEGIVTSNVGDDVTFTLSLNEVTDTAIDVANDSFVFIDSDDSNNNKKEAVADLITAIAGDGLGATSGVLAVNVDNSSIEINADTLRIKALGVTNAMLVNDSVTVGSTEIDLGTTAASLDGLNTLHGIDASGTDVAGTDLTIQAGAGTGSGAGGSILFQTADGSTSGTGVNSFTTAMTIADDGGVTIAGDLTVNGTTTTVNSNTVEIGDNIILLNRDETGTPSQNAGIEIERGTATNVYLRWNETSDIWQVFEPDPNNSNTLTTANLLTTVNFQTQITTLDGGTF